MEGTNFNGALALGRFRPFRSILAMLFHQTVRSTMQKNLRNESLGRILCLMALCGLNGCQSLTNTPVGNAGGAPAAVLAAQAPGAPGPPLYGGDVPVEQSKVSLPPYQIEAPDILFVDAIKVVPKSPFRISPQDTLQIRAAGTLADQPINGYFVVEPGGAVELGPAYGKVNVVGLSLDEATEVVENQLRRLLKQPQVSLTLAQSAGQQEIAGEHLVASDGRINLGIYGGVYVAGMTVNEARQAIETHLTKFLDDPHVAVDVGAYNSKVYYIITDGAGFGDSVVRFSVTGNETVLDALSQINGLSRLASKSHIWIARPAPERTGCDQILPINWDRITKDGETATNYQVLPGDRIFISADKFYTFDTALGNVIAPIQRLFGTATLGVQTIFGIQHPGIAAGGAGGGGSRF